jgi:hypothetical protein
MILSIWTTSIVAPIRGSSFKNVPANLISSDKLLSLREEVELAGLISDGFVTEEGFWTD